MERYITQHYKTPILGSSYSYLLQALSNVLILLSFLLFSITTAIPISLQYLEQYILWWLQSNHPSLPLAVTTPQFSVLATIRPSQSEQPILQATVIGVGKGMYRDLPNKSESHDLFRDRRGDKMMSLGMSGVVCKYETWIFPAIVFIWGSNSENAAKSAKGEDVRITQKECNDQITLETCPLHLSATNPQIWGEYRGKKPV